MRSEVICAPLCNGVSLECGSLAPLWPVAAWRHASVSLPLQKEFASGLRVDQRAAGPAHSKELNPRMGGFA
jgi:hypothetical protein